MKMRYLYTMEYYSAIKKNEMMPFAATWVDLEIVVLSEDREILYDIPYMLRLKRNKTNEVTYKTCKTEPDSPT